MARRGTRQKARPQSSAARTLTFTLALSVAFATAFAAALAAALAAATTARPLRHRRYLLQNGLERLQRGPLTATAVFVRATAAIHTIARRHRLPAAAEDRPDWDACAGQRGLGDDGAEGGRWCSRVRKAKRNPGEIISCLLQKLKCHQYYLVCGGRHELPLRRGPPGAWDGEEVDGAGSVRVSKEAQ